MATAFHELSKHAVQRTMARYFQLAKDAEMNLVRETNASILIQRAWRRCVQRQHQAYLNAMAVRIQRMWRGKAARAMFRRALKLRQIEMEMQAYNFHATTIQRVWRGHVSRHLRGIPKRHYAKRKELLAQAYEAGEKLRRDAIEYNQAVMNIVTAQQHEEKGKRFYELAKKFHHLGGTASIPSVFQSPFPPPLVSPSHITSTTSPLPLSSPSPSASTVSSPSSQVGSSSVRTPRRDLTSHQPLQPIDRGNSSTSSAYSSVSYVRGVPMHSMTTGGVSFEAVLATVRKDIAREYLSTKTRGHKSGHAGTPISSSSSSSSSSPQSQSSLPISVTKSTNRTNSGRNHSSQRNDNKGSINNGLSLPELAPSNSSPSPTQQRQHQQQQQQQQQRNVRPLVLPSIKRDDASSTISVTNNGNRPSQTNNNHNSINGKLLNTTDLAATLPSSKQIAVAIGSGTGSKRGSIVSL